MRASLRPVASASLCAVDMALFLGFAGIPRPSRLAISANRDAALSRARASLGSPGMEQPLHRQLGMTDDELAAVVDELGREPTHLELAMYSVMWAEHCSYKSSRAFLSRFPTHAPWVLVGPGEGAGVVDIGDGLAVAG